jgi:hypothetical protein
MTRDRSKRANRCRGLHLLKEIIGEIHAANAHIPAGEIEKIVDDTVREVREERRAKQKVEKA